MPETCRNALAKAVPEIMNIPQRKYTSNQYHNYLIVMCLSINLTYILLKFCLDIGVHFISYRYGLKTILIDVP